MKPAIEITHLSKKYRKGSNSPYLTLRDKLAGIFSPSKSRQLDSDEFWALKDINLKIMPGEVVGIIGRNGAGKSTLLKILSRITHPTEGEVILRGRVGSLLEVGTGFHQELSGRENIYLNGAVLGMSRKEVKRKFDEIVSFAEIGEFIDTPVKHYSSGMYMRLAFAVAAHLETEILLLDEVLAVGDIQFQEKCFQKIESITSNKARTIFIVSHNLGNLSRLCSKIVYLDSGKIIKAGTPQQVISHYHNTTEVQTGITTYSKNNLLEAQIRKIHILGEHVKDYQEEVNIDITINVNNPGLQIYLVILIRNSTGENIIFWRDFELNNRLTKVRQTGCYKYKIAIPSHTLSPGKYAVEAAIGDLSRSTDVDKPLKYPTFEIIDQRSIRSAQNLPWRSVTGIPLRVDISLNDVLLPNSKKKGLL